ncbi:MAG: hypothetical protein ACR2IF_17160 [Terriglobales bacterium]
MAPRDPGDPQVTAYEPEQPGSGRDPEERPVSDCAQEREKMLDKTIADSFPTSDPPSSIPNPCPEDLPADDAA